MMFIKIFDEKTALELKECGFTFTTETINNDLKLYCFEASSEFLEVFNGKFSSDIKFVCDNALRFFGSGDG